MRSRRASCFAWSRARLVRARVGVRAVRIAASARSPAGLAIGPSSRSRTSRRARQLPPRLRLRAGMAAHRGAHSRMLTRASWSRGQARWIGPQFAGDASILADPRTYAPRHHRYCVIAPTITAALGCWRTHRTPGRSAVGRWRRPVDGRDMAAALRPGVDAPAPAACIRRCGQTGGGSLARHDALYGIPALVTSMKVSTSRPPARRATPSAPRSPRRSRLSSERFLHEDPLAPRAPE